MKNAVLEALGYDRSPNFLPSSELDERPFAGYTHVYRKVRDHCDLQGVYLLKDLRAQKQLETPVLFYCTAESEEAAAQVHRRVWNTGTVPFLLVETPRQLRLYSGFRFAPPAASDEDRGVLAASVTFNEVASRLAAFRAEAIDSGAVWDHWGQVVDPHHRVNDKLLAELEKLEAVLRERGLERRHAHALIGKYAYLKYLRDRQILSDRKLSKWGLEERAIFGPRATRDAFQTVNERLEDWLNGSAFPLSPDNIGEEHLQLVASVFAGGTSAGQLPLDLAIYDFSWIPIETLSVIYQQFLHAPESGGSSRGRQKGAYYTPVFLVNYLLGELAARRPLREGMRVLDPACGSGAFLVQCYRSLIEQRRQLGPVRPVELRELLTRHIFGVDSDEDACRMAEMSLVLTLLDYIEPPDLESQPQFKLPALRGKNIFEADFFDPDSLWARRRSKLKVDWLVGNPPWKEAKRNVGEDHHARQWMEHNAQKWPTGGNQVAEAFVWHSLPLLADGAVAALLLPAMTLFKMESSGFRARLFETVRAWSVVNFANLAYVLFAGRSQAPASAFFFEPRVSGTEMSEQERILTFAPFLANQPAGRAPRLRRSKETWSIVVNGGELRELRAAEVLDGDFRPWKQAMWGSFRDGKLLARLERRFPSLEVIGRQLGLRVHEGFQLRQQGSGVEAMPQIAGRTKVDFTKLKQCGRIFALPKTALAPIPDELAYVRKGRGRLPWQVSTPPHILVDEGRRLAIFSNDFIAIPARQIGIHGDESRIALLKALSLYLSSDFCRYHQFFVTSQWGVSSSISTLRALKSLPIPVAQLSDSELREWARLQERLAAESAGGVEPPERSLQEVDERVYRLLGLSRPERILIEDFVKWRLQIVKGKVPAGIVSPPTDSALTAYLAILKEELDEFIGRGSGLSHELLAVRGKGSAMLAIRLAPGAAQPAVLQESGGATAKALEETRQHLLQEHSQWLYFERGLKIYQEGTMYFFKPLEAIHWTRRQAILDAGEIIAETLGNPDA